MKFKNVCIKNMSEECHRQLKSMAAARGITIAEMLSILVAMQTKRDSKKN